MPEIQIINLRGQTAAIVAGDSAILAEHVPGDLVAHVQAKALYAMQIQAGELPGPYTDAGAERYAQIAAATPARPAPRERPQPGRARRGAYQRRHQQ